MPAHRRHRFRAMGTAVSLLGPRTTGEGRREFDLASCAVEAVFRRLDRCFSRFRPDSELSRVNASCGRCTRVSMTFAELLEISLAAARWTDGLFDPTVLRALVAAGYDKDWKDLSTGGVRLGEPPRPGRRWEGVEVRGTMVRLPNGVGLDFGGVAKGWAADRAAEAAGLSWAVVSAGGDLRLSGRPPGGAMDVGVEDPAEPTSRLLHLRLERGALATSSVLSRTWGEGLHQLIDPRTSRPAATGVIQATTWAPTCAEAETRATWAMLAGPAILDRLPGVLVMDDGRVLLNLEPAEGLGIAEAERVSR